VESSDARFSNPQHPPSDAAPAISVRLAEPPSVEGTGGGQTAEAEPGAAAVVLAAWVDVSGISPGNSKGVCEFPEAEPVAPAVPLAAPAVFVEPADVPNCEADEGTNTDEENVVDTALPLLLGWPLTCDAVCPCCWPWAVVMPRTMTAMMKKSFIALSCVNTAKLRSRPRA
jgi:hypothetical protein